MVKYLVLLMVCGASVAKGQSCNDFDFPCRFPWHYENSQPVDFILDSRLVISETNCFKYPDGWRILDTRKPAEVTFHILSEKPIKFSMLHSSIRTNFTNDTEFLQILSGPDLDSLTEIDYADWQHYYNGFTELLSPLNPNSENRELFIRTRFQGPVLIAGMVSIYHTPEPSLAIVLLGTMSCLVIRWRQRR